MLVSLALFYSSLVGLVLVLKADHSGFKLEPMLVSAGLGGGDTFFLGIRHYHLLCLPQITFRERRTHLP